MTARIAVVYAEGATSPTQIARGLCSLADIHFAVARSPHVREVTAPLEQYGTGHHTQARG